MTAGTQECLRVRVQGPQAGEEWLAPEGEIAQQGPEDRQDGRVAVALAGDRRGSRRGVDPDRTGPGGPDAGLTRWSVVGEHERVRSPPLGHQDLREPAQG